MEEFDPIDLKLKEGDPDWPSWNLRFSRFYDPVPERGAWHYTKGKKRPDRGPVMIGHIDTGVTKHYAFRRPSDTVSRPGAFDWGLSENLIELGEEPVNPFKPVDYRGPDIIPSFFSHGTSTSGVLLAARREAESVSPAGAALGGAPEAVGVAFRVSDTVLINSRKLERSNPGNDERYRENSSYTAAENCCKALNKIADLAKKGQPIAVVSISLAGPKSSALDGPLSKSIKAVRDEGVIVVAASGQFPYGSYGQAIAKAAPSELFKAMRTEIGRLPEAVMSEVVGGIRGGYHIKILPAAYHSVVAVTALDENGEKLKGGFYDARYCDIAAPGVGVTRPVAQRDEASGAYTYTVPPGTSGGDGKGTSYATPLVASACALWQDQWGRTELKSRYGKGNLWLVFKAALFDSCSRPRVNNQAWTIENGQGVGILNAGKLVETKPPGWDTANQAARLNAVKNKFRSFDHPLSKIRDSEKIKSPKLQIELH